jgi:hypothetical protein|tara:strand:- start:1274 stop:1594 length:321 start_codon:yes stop_codon:yes gene_type:complete
MYSKKRSSKKGAKSKTHKGDLDYTTKKGDKDFHRKGHDQKESRRPFMPTNHGDMGEGGSGMGDEAEQKHSHRRHPMRKTKMSLLEYRQMMGLAPRTERGDNYGTGI